MREESIIEQSELNSPEPQILTSKVNRYNKDLAMTL